MTHYETSIFTFRYSLIVECRKGTIYLLNRIKNLLYQKHEGEQLCGLPNFQLQGVAHGSSRNYFWHPPPPSPSFSKFVFNTIVTYSSIALHYLVLPLLSIIISQHQHYLAIALALLSISIAQHQHRLALALLSISIAQHSQH